MSLFENYYIYQFHKNLHVQHNDYLETYNQTHDVSKHEFNLKIDLNYVINRFINICANRALMKIFMIMTENENEVLVVDSFEDFVMIFVKFCTHCKKTFFTMSECHVKHLHLREKRNRNEFEDKNRVNKRKRDKKNLKSFAIKKNVELETYYVVLVSFFETYIAVSTNIFTTMSVIIFRFIFEF